MVDAWTSVPAVMLPSHPDEGDAARAEQSGGARGDVGDEDASDRHTGRARDGHTGEGVAAGRADDVGRVDDDRGVRGQRGAAVVFTGMSV